MKKNVCLKIFMDYFVAIIAILFLVFIAPKIIMCFMPFVIGWIISLIANPLVKFMEKKIKIVRKHGSAIFIVLVIAIIVGIVYGTGYFLYEQTTKFRNEAPAVWEKTKVQLNDAMVKYEKLYKKMPKFVKEYVDSFGTGASTKNKKETSSIDMASSIVKNVATAIISFIFTVLAAYFFTADREILLKKIKKVMPKSIYKNTKLVIDNFKFAVGGYFKAQFKIMIVLVAIMYVAFLIFGVKYAFLIALFTGFLDVLPVFGTGAVLWPWTVYYIIIENYYIAAGMIVLYAVCQLVKQLLQPKMVGDSVGLSPLLTLFLLFLGYQIGDLLGILIALPLGMVVINLYKAGAFNLWIDDFIFVRNKIYKFNAKNNAYIKEEIEKDNKEIYENIDEDSIENDKNKVKENEISDKTKEKTKNKKRKEKCHK